MDRTPSTILAGSIVAGLAFTSTATAQFNFDPATNVAAGSQPSGAAAGDFDGDGDMDLATTVDGPDRIIVLFNDGNGSYTIGAASLLPNSSSPQDLIAGKLDGDDDVDLAVAVRDPNGAVLIMSNNGAGNFTMIGSVAVGDRPRGLAIGDVEPDGDMDLAVANRNDSNASVLINNGAGSFSASTLAVGGETRATAFGDLDNDNDLDLAVTNHDGRSVHLFSNNGGAFSANGTLSVGALVRPDGVTIADVDGDGDQDVATATSDQTLNINQATIFLNAVTAFTGPFNYPTGGDNTSGIRAADFDCDGAMDLVAVNEDSNNVSLLRNTGGGVYGAPQIMAAGTGADEIVTGDFDGDTDADFATANRDSNDMSIFINQTCTAGIPGDANGDGVVDFGDILVILAEWGDCPGCPGDVNDDGVVDFGDILLVLANWS